MLSSESTAVARATELRGKPLHRGATHCTGILPAVARAIWPRKTAFHWAAASGVKERMAKYWLAGHPVSADGRLALIRQIE